MVQLINFFFHTTTSTRSLGAARQAILALPEGRCNWRVHEPHLSSEGEASARLDDEQLRQIVVFLRGLSFCGTLVTTQPLAKVRDMVPGVRDQFSDIRVTTELHAIVS